MQSVVRTIQRTVSPQAAKVLGYMEKTNGSITAREGMLDLDITSATLARRICDLEAVGVVINRLPKVHPGTGKRYTQYVLNLTATSLNLEEGDPQVEPLPGGVVRVLRNGGALGHKVERPGGLYTVKAVDSDRTVLVETDDAVQFVHPRDYRVIE